MEWTQIVQAAAALIFVIGLLLVCLWIFKVCEQKSLNCKLFCGLNADRRLKVVDKRQLDAKNQVVLLQDGQTEYLLLLGTSGNLVLTSRPIERTAND